MFKTISLIKVTWNKEEKNQTTSIEHSFIMTRGLQSTSLRSFHNVYHCLSVLYIVVDKVTHWFSVISCLFSVFLGCSLWLGTRFNVNQDNLLTLVNRLTSVNAPVNVRPQGVGVGGRPGVGIRVIRQTIIAQGAGIRQEMSTHRAGNSIYICM